MGMNNSTFDRYHFIKEKTHLKVMPFVSIPKFSGDYYETYIQGISRLDNISYKYYRNPNYDWLILMANPEVGSLEFNIPDGYKLRIPFPLNSVLSKYDELINDYYKENF